MRFASLHKFAADINLFVYVGVGYIREAITNYVSSMGGGYNETLIKNIEDEVIQHADVLEDLLVREWADIAVVEFDGSYGVHGTIEYEGVETELDESEVREIEKIVDDFVYPFVEESIDKADVGDLVWIPVQSSNVEAIAYDYKNRFLYVKFLPSGTGDFSMGSTYYYESVEPYIYDQFLMAPSKGKFHWQYIRDRYDYGRIR